MASQKINIGHFVNDGLGDDLRTAFLKVNQNFENLDNELTLQAANSSTAAGFGIFKEKVNQVLVFKNLIAGDNIYLEPLSDAIKISSPNSYTFDRVNTQDGAVYARNTPALEIFGGKNTVTRVVNDRVIVDTKLDLEQLLQTYDFGYYDRSVTSIFQLLASSSNIDFGTFDNPAEINLDLGTW